MLSTAAVVLAVLGVAAGKPVAKSFCSGKDWSAETGGPRIQIFADFMEEIERINNQTINATKNTAGKVIPKTQVCMHQSSDASVSSYGFMYERYDHRESTFPMSSWVEQHSGLSVHVL